MADEKRRPEQGPMEGPGAGEEQQPVSDGEPIWVLSNRVDDRVVLFERSPEHPGGEAFVGGAAPARVGRTGTVEDLLRRGLLLEVPEPPEGPKKPKPTAAVAEFARAQQPGQPIRLGRVPNPDIWKGEDLKQIERARAAAPKEVPLAPGTIVPQVPEQRSASRR